MYPERMISIERSEVNMGRASRDVTASRHVMPVAGIVLSWALIACPATAQTIYRCVQKGRPVSLQSTPCDRGAATTRTRHYTPEPAPTANDLAWKRYRIEREMALRNQAQRAGAASGSVVVLPAGGSACAQAKAERDAWERRVGLNRTIDGMRAWQERVYHACR